MQRHEKRGARGTRGQALIEIIITIAILAIVGSSIATLIVTTQRNQENAKRRDAAVGLVTESFTALRTIAESDDSTSQGFNRLYCPPSGSCPGNGKGTGVHYGVTLSGGVWGLMNGSGAMGASDQTTVLAGVTYTRAITFENVCRDPSWSIIGATDSNGSATTCTPGTNTEDPGTQRVTVTLTAPQMSNLVVTQYMSRWRNVASTQTDWSGGTQ